MENLIGFFDAQSSRRAVPRVERAGAAGSEPGENRVAATARKTLGVSVLSRSARASRRTKCPESVGAFGRGRGFPAGARQLPGRRVAGALRPFSKPVKLRRMTALI